jgi:hypothetical protein
VAVTFKFSDIVISISNGPQGDALRLEEAFNNFLSSGEPEVIIKAHFNGLPDIPLRVEDKVFDSESIWSLYRAGRRNVFVLRIPGQGSPPYRMAVFDEGFRQGDIYSRISGPGPIPEGLYNPLEFPLSLALMVCLLAQGRGVLVHACGIDDNGSGYLFAGNSTHGKSTMANLWKEEATILNDDRIIVRLRDGRFWMYGTPWHGDYGSTSPQGVPLEKIFFLRHAEKNSAELKEGISAVTMLLARCFPPLWDPQGMRYTLDFCSKLSENVPCYELGVAPDSCVVDFIRCVK